MMSSMSSTGTRPVAALVALALTLGAGCSSTSAPDETARTSRTDLDASIAQFRSDEGSARLTAGVTNDGKRTIRVTAATIRWGGLRFPVVRLDGAAVPPGETAVFTTSYGAAGCDTEPGAGPMLIAVVDGRRTTLPLTQDDPTLFRRLHTSTCARQRLDAVATVRVVTARSLERVSDGFALPAAIVLTRRSGSTEPLRLVDLAGSVLLTLSAADGRRALPVVLRPEQQEVRVPVTFGSTHRCDGHSLGQSQQTFVLSAYLRVPGDSVQRQILHLTERDLAALQEVIDRSCPDAG